MLLDLEPVLGVQLAARLSERRLAHVVLLLPRWPYADAVLRTQELTRVLLDESRRLTTNPHLSNVAFVIDRERSKPAHKLPRQADNRYRLSTADLPNLQTLRSHGIRRVMKLS